MEMDTWESTGNVWESIGAFIEGAWNTVLDFFESIADAFSGGSGKDNKSIVPNGEMLPGDGWGGNEDDKWGGPNPFDGYGGR